MGLFDLVKRSLGFGGDNYEAEEENHEHRQDDEVQQNNAAAVSVSEKSVEVEILEFEPHMKKLLFDNVLKVFDEALPDFLRRSMDAEAQRTALYEALDKSVADYLVELEKRSSALAQTHSQAATEQAKAENERLVAELKQAQQQKEKIREQQLSAERRLRAQQDRTKSLEEQVSKLEAENEQYQLENSSLVNKVKLAQVQPEVIADLQKEIERLRNGDAGVAEEARKTAEAQLAQTRAELQDAKQQSEDLRQGVELSNKMYTETLEDLTGERAQHEATKKELEAAAAERDTAKKELEAAQSELEQARQKLVDQEEITATVEQLSGKMEQIEETISARDQKIAQLKEANHKLKEELAELRERQQEATESGADRFTMPENVEDDDFECPEWFVSEPGHDSSALRREPNLDFGYNEPPKKPKAPESDAQLPLF